MVSYHEARFNRLIKSKCTIRTKSGIKVQSHGEKLIADFLFDNDILFLYDDLRKWIMWIRPDFLIPEPCIAIEYWGLKDRDGSSDYDEEVITKYNEDIEWRKGVYKCENVPLIEIFRSDLPLINKILRLELKEVGYKFKK